MATLALRPAFPTPTQSGWKRGPRKQRGRDVLHPRPWRTMAITAGTVALTAFVVVAPMIGDPAGRLFALDATPTIPTWEAIRGDGSSARTFEFTPTMLGPEITADMFTLTEEDVWVVTMPELEVRAVPPIDGRESSPPG
jgi:hypothetical protein